MYWLSKLSFSPSSRLNVMRTSRVLVQPATIPRFQIVHAHNDSFLLHAYVWQGLCLIKIKWRYFSPFNQKSIRAFFPPSKDALSHSQKTHIAVHSRGPGSGSALLALENLRFSGSVANAEENIFSHSPKQTAGLHPGVGVWGVAPLPTDIESITQIL
jgi:hypothetical protein